MKRTATAALAAAIFAGLSGVALAHEDAPKNPESSQGTLETVVVSAPSYCEEEGDAAAAKMAAGNIFLRDVLKQGMPTQFPPGVSDCLDQWFDVSSRSAADLKVECEMLYSPRGSMQMRSEAVRYGKAHHLTAKTPLGAPTPQDSTAPLPTLGCGKIDGFLSDLESEAKRLAPKILAQQAAEARKQEKAEEQIPNAFSIKKSPGSVNAAGADSVTPIKASMSSLADTTSYVMVPEQDAGDMYLAGAEKETVCLPPAQGGKCWKLALKVVSSVGAADQAGVGKVGDNYIAVVDYTNPEHITQVTFPDVVCNPAGSSPCNSFDLSGEGKKYKFSLGRDDDGGLTIFRADSGPATRPPKKKGFWGGIENLFNDVKYDVASMLHGTTLTPVAYTSTAQLYMDRNDEIQNRPTAQVTLGGQKFNIISQGGPRGCLLFFAVGADGGPMTTNDGEYPGYKPNMMACVNQAEPDGVPQMISGPQCLGSFPHGDQRDTYSIQWLPHSAGGIGSDYKINKIPEGTGACAPPDPAGSKPDKPSGPASNPGTNPTPASNNQCQSGEVLQGKTGKCCPSGEQLSADEKQCVTPDSGQNQCEYNLNGENASGNAKMKVRDLGDGYALYLGTYDAGQGTKLYQSYVCDESRMIQVPGVVSGNVQSKNGEISITAYNLGYDGSVSPKDFADMTPFPAASDVAKKGFPEDFVKLKDGHDLEFSKYNQGSNAQMSKAQIYNLPEDDFGTSAPKKALLSQNVASSIVAIDPLRNEVSEIDVYPRGGSVTAAVRNAINNQLQNMDKDQAAALQNDKNGVLKDSLGLLPSDASVEIHFVSGQNASQATGCSPAVTASYSAKGKTVSKTLVDYQFGKPAVTLSPFMARCEPKSKP